MLYRIVTVGKEPERSGDPTSFLKPPGPEIRLSPPAPVPLAEWPLSGHLKQQLEAMTSRIETMMPLGGGVLIDLTVHEERRPNLGDRPGQRLIGIELAGVGMVASLAARIRLRNPSLVKRAPKGWMAKTVYLWATR